MEHPDRWPSPEPRPEPLYTGHEWASVRHRVEYIEGGRAPDAVIKTCALCAAEMGTTAGNAPCTGTRPPRPIFGQTSDEGGSAR